MKLELGNTYDVGGEYIGRKDAFHVSAVLCTPDDDIYKLAPGQKVRFTGDAFSKVRPTDTGEEYHGIIDPFANSLPLDEMFWVIIRPGLASGVRHDFNINITDARGFQSGQWDCRNCD